MEKKLLLGVDCKCDLYFILLNYNATIFLEYATN